MGEKDEPKPILISQLTPPVLSPEEEVLCKRLDDLHAKNGLGSKPSDMFLGALFAARPEMQRINPDWAAQAAHSLREILYTFNSKVKKRAEAFEKAGAVRVDAELKELYAIYGRITEVAHHAHPGNDGSGSGKFDDEDFRELLDDFKRAATRALRRQLDVHKEVDSFVSQWPEVAAESQA